MKYKKILIVAFITFLAMSFIFSNLCCQAYFWGGDTEYVWSESTVETSSGEESEDFLDLSCESAILIEQTTRNNFI